MPTTLDEKKLKRIIFDVKCAWDDLRSALNDPGADKADMLASARTRLEGALAALKTDAAQ